ncbi:transcription factor bHLH36-like [Mercurialis annua]|uniref:transcription factor bHLH36-like n=1 Tax=Mercurialis annua TaxID=3986 RepID=UPI00215F6E06|nr:transcription factor bHLH36-like [Mercurialis annua]
MRPSNQLSFQINNNSNQEIIIPEDTILIFDNSSAHGPSQRIKGRPRNPSFSHQEHDHATDSKKTLHREIERQRRREMATLFISLRDLLPLEYIKGKRAAADHIHVTVKYIKDLEKKIKHLSMHRDEIKNLPNLSHGGSSEDLDSCACAPTYITIKPCLIGLEVVIISSVSDQIFCLSRALELLIEHGLDVVSCTSAKVVQRIIHTIQSKVRYMIEIDVSELQNKLKEAIP